MSNSLPKLEQYEQEIREALLVAYSDESNTYFGQTQLEDVEKFNGQDGGANSKLLAAAWAFLKAGVEEAQAYDALYFLYSIKYEATAEQEVKTVIQKTYHSKDKEFVKSKPKFNEPKRNEAIENIRKFTAGFKPFDFKSSDYSDLKPSQYLDKLYSDENWICIAPNAKRVKTMKKVKAVQTVTTQNTCFFVANPMRQKTGKTLTGTDSQRCKNNATKEGEESYLLYENDLGKSDTEEVLSQDEQYKLLAFLIEALPVVSVTFSGNSSHHVLISVKGLAKHKIYALKQLLINLGADKAVLQPWQLSRLPNAIRENGNRQKLLFLDEQAIGKEPSELDLIQLGANMNELKEPSKLDPEVYMLTDSNKYIRQLTDKSYLTEDYYSMRRSLKHKGISSKDAAYLLEEVKEHSQVAFYGQIAGRSAGLHIMSGQKVLVRSSPNLLTPIRGFFPLCKEIFDRMLGGRDGIQLDSFYSVLKRFVTCLYSGVYQPIQIMALCGSPNCGKSFTSEVIIRNLAGGRIADPTDYLKGNTIFNENVAASEVLVMGDKFGEFSLPAREKFGSNLKEYAANEHMILHGKFKAQVSVVPIQIAIITLNEEKDDVAILPPLRSGVEDKIHLFSCSGGEMPMPTHTYEQKKAFEAAVLAELPALLHFLLYEYKIPESLVDQRFGVKAYHHPKIVDLMEDIDDRNDLEPIIQKALFGEQDNPQPVYMNTTELYSAILDGLEFTPLLQVFKMVVRNPNSLGRALGILKRKKPDAYRDEKRTVNGLQVRGWEIWPISNQVSERKNDSKSS